MIPSSLSRIPRPNSAFENNTVTGIEKHLRRTASSRLIWALVVIFEYQADVADARSDTGQFPGPSACFVVCRRGHIPRDLRNSFAKISNWIPEGVKEFEWSDCALFYDLGQNTIPKQSTF